MEVWVEYLNLETIPNNGQQGAEVVWGHLSHKLHQLLLDFQPRWLLPCPWLQRRENGNRDLSRLDEDRSRDPLLFVIVEEEVCTGLRMIGGARPSYRARRGKGVYGCPDGRRWFAANRPIQIWGRWCRWTKTAVPGCRHVSVHIARMGIVHLCFSASVLWISNRTPSWSMTLEERRALQSPSSAIVNRRIAQ